MRTRAVPASVASERGVRREDRSTYREREEVCALHIGSGWSGTRIALATSCPEPDQSGMDPGRHESKAEATARP